MDSLTTTNILLAVIALVQVMWLAAAVIGALYAKNAVSRAEASLARFEADHIQPLTAKVGHILGDVSHAAETVQQRAASVEAGLASSYQAAERQARRVASALNTVAVETTAVASGVRAAVSAVAQPTTPSSEGAPR